jgi:hypothetical protein
VDPLEDVRNRDAPRDHVDDVGLCQHRADRGAGFGRVGLQREAADLVERHAEVAPDVLQELTRAGGALAGHAIAEHLGPIVDADGTGVERADVDHRSRRRLEQQSAAGVRRHAVEVTGAELDAVALTGRGHVGEGLAVEPGLSQRGLKRVFGDAQRIALADALDLPGQDPLVTGLGVLDDRHLDGGRAHVDPRADEGAFRSRRHEAPPAAAVSPGPSRRANSAAPSAPV